MSNKISDYADFKVAADMAVKLYEFTNANFPNVDVATGFMAFAIHMSQSFAGEDVAFIKKFFDQFGDVVAAFANGWDESCKKGGKK